MSSIRLKFRVQITNMRNDDDIEARLVSSSSDSSRQTHKETSCSIDIKIRRRVLIVHFNQRCDLLTFGVMPDDELALFRNNH